MARRAVKAVLALLLILALTAAWTAWFTWQKYQAFLLEPLNIPVSGAVLEVQAGMTGGDIVAGLAAGGFTREGWPWRLLMRLEPAVYRVGEYRLQAGMNPREVLQHLASGKVIQYRFTIVEGWSFRQLAQALSGRDDLVQDPALHDPAEWNFKQLFAEMNHPEGWFLPETYVFVKGDSTGDVLQRAYQSMLAELEDAWAARDTALPLSDPYELLILASIIEKETALDSERGEIAGVFVRRLNKRMRLQTDPTVIYGMGDRFDGDIRRKDLRTDTPYNTYTRHGLPPTPIALPGRASLQAAAHPEPGETLYFVADGKGGHTFSRTLEEHQKAVDKLIGRN
jgi:UPF0755 protein